jgi:hypothetical protein
MIVRKSECLPDNTFADHTGNMIVEGIPRAVQRPEPESDVVVAAYTCHADDGVERLVRVDGLDPTDYLTSVEARALARALDAAVDELARCG